MALADEEDAFYKNPLDGKPLVARPRVPARRSPAGELAFAKAQAAALHAKGYSARQIVRGLGAVGIVVTLEQVELWEVSP